MYHIVDVFIWRVRLLRFIWSETAAIYMK